MKFSFIINEINQVHIFEKYIQQYNYIKKETKDSFSLHSIIMKNEKNTIFQIMRE